MIFRSRSERSAAGFTLIEILLTMSLVAIMSTVGITLLSGSVDEGRYDATVEEMKQIRNAFVGDPDARQGGTRSSFGYVGDMGGLPTAVQGMAALLSAPEGSVAWAVNNAARFGLGWNGPYVSSGLSGQDPLTDAWGRAYIYAAGAAATLTSLGADGAAGGTGYNQDIVVSMPLAQRVATVYGFVSDGGSPYTGAAQAEIFFPNGNGVLTSTLTSIAAGSQGAFQFANIPLGQRSLVIYFPTKASATRTIGPIVFSVDRPRFLVPVSLTDRNPGNGASGSSGGGNCVSPSGQITLAPFVADSTGSTINFRVQLSTGLTLNSVAVQLAASVRLNEVSINSVRFRCTGSRTLQPCPADPGMVASLAPAPALSGSASRPITLTFNGSVASVSGATVVVSHSGGCDILNLTGLL